MALLCRDVWPLRDGPQTTSSPLQRLYNQSIRSSSHTLSRFWRFHLHWSFAKHSSGVPHSSSSSNSFESSEFLQECRINESVAHGSEPANNDLNDSDERGYSSPIASEYGKSGLNENANSGTSSAYVCGTNDIDEHERKRRERIATANKGKIPWNKGKSHSPATIALMRERNKVVMQDPRIREKLRKHSHPQSPETREKLRVFMRTRMEHERKQLTLIQEWKDVIAENARIGNLGDDELQWDSYTILKEQLRQEHINNKKKKKERVHRSLPLEQRLKISASVRAKWEDPEFRKKVIKNMHEKKLKNTRTKKYKENFSDVEFDNLLDVLTRTPTSKDMVGFSETKIGSYSDPSSKEKLAKLLHVRKVKCGERMLESEIRDDHPGSEKRNVGEKTELEALQKAHLEAADRARILLAEAELAARALEAAGARDENLTRSLLEARTLLDEANKTLSNTQVVSPPSN